MKKNFKGLFGAFLANTPPCKLSFTSRKFLCVLFLVLFSITNVWGETVVWNPSSAVSSDKTISQTLDNAIVISAYGGATIEQKQMDSSTKAYGIKIGTSANSNLGAGYVEIKVNNISSDISNVLLGTSSNGDAVKKYGVVYFSALEATKEKIISGETLSSISKKTGSIDDRQQLNVPKGTKMIRIYRKINTSATGLANDLGEGSTIYVYSFSVDVTSSTPETTYAITYNLGDGTGTIPTQDALAEGKTFTLHNGVDGITAPSGQEFAGWSDGTNTYAAGATYTMDAADVVLTAQWRAETVKYAVTYDLNGGVGTAPTQAATAEGDKFTLASIDGITAPTGKEFAGWSDGTNTYNVGDTYTMGNAPIEFVAQWKSVPVTIFHWKSNTGTINIDESNGTTIGGTTTLRTADPNKSWGNESVTYDGSVADDMKGETSGKELKPGGNANYLELTLTSGTFQEGDVIYVTGYNNWAFLTSTENISSTTSFDVANVETGTRKESAVTGSATIPAGIDASTIYARRANGSSSGIAAIKVTRVVKDILSTVNTLTDVKIGESSISAANLATLVSEHSLSLNDAEASAPTITFNQHTVITYEDYSTKTTDTPILVVASDNGAGKWTASATIDAVTYTVILDIASGHSVIYNANGGSGTMTDANLYAEGDEVTVLENIFIAPAANQKFNGWSSSPSVTISEGKFEMPASDVTLSAQWKEFFIITYMDESVTLGTEEVFVDNTPVGLSPAPTKPLSSLIGWKDALGADIDITTLSADATVYAKWEKAFASSVDLEDLVEASGTSADWQTYLLEHNFGFSTSGVSLDAKASGKTYENWPYQGLKAKAVGAYVEGNINAGKLVIIKLGHMAAAANVSIDGVAIGTATGLDAAEPAGQLNYFYVENEALLRYETTNDGACVLKAITIQDPYTVSFDVNGGDAIEQMSAKPSITLPTPTNGTLNFAGWYVGENKIGDAGDTYLPTENVELVAHWEALSTINTLSDLQVDGVTVDGFSSDVHTYNIVVPYGTDVANLPKITSATATNANANVVIWPDAPAWTDDFGGCYRQQANVTPQDPNAAVGYNDIRITIAPKDGVSIIKVATTGGENKTVTGLYAGDGDVNLSSNMKMDNGKYIGFTLAGTTLQVGDQINVHTTEASTTGDSHIIFYDNMTDKKELYETGEIGVVGDNIFTINAAMVGSTSAYVYRANTDNAHKWNGYIDFIEVLRPMNPVLTAITFDGTAAEMGVGNTFSVTLQNGTDLNAMTVVPTIVKNGEGGSAAPLVAWAWGENTYRVTDKDGDYTDYTITLTGAASPSAAPVITTQPADGNYIEGETITALKVVATGSGELSYQWYLGAEAIDGATAATYTPTVDAIGLYVYHCVVTNTEAGHPATSLVSSDATITIAEDPAAIKLLNDAGAINTTDFITGVSANTVNFNDAVHNCATFGSTASTVVGASGLNKYIIYNSKTTQTKIKFVLYNVQNASVTMKLQKLVEGGTEMEEVVINVPSKEVFTTDFYTFDGSANRTMYAFVQNTGIKVLQVKVIDNGTPLKQFGEVGYSINFNKGRLFLASGNEIAYDGLTYNASSNYAPLNNEGLSLASSKSYRFEVPADVTMTVTAANNKKYYITDKEDGSDNETAAAEARSFDLTAGAWYLRVDGSNLGLTKIEFTAPKCEVPVFNALANSDICSGESYVPLNGTAIVSDGGTVTYKWYAEGGTEVLAETATYTPTADGSYYVVATNSLVGYTDNVVQSEVVTVTTHTGAAITAAPENVRMDAGETATLAVVATGKNVTYQWYTCDENGDNAELIDGAEAATYQVEVTAAMHQYYKVVVGSDCGEASAVALVEEWHEIAPANVTGSRTWDWAAESMGTIETVSGSTEYLMANVSSQVPNTEAFRSDMLYITANYANRSTSNKFFQGWQIRFYTEVPGRVSLECRAIHEKVSITINGTVIDAERGGSMTPATTPFLVPAGWVTIVFDNTSTGEYADEPARVQKIVFNATPDYTRDVTVGSLGTICLPSNVPAGQAFGATFYELVGKEPQYGKIVFDEILSGELEAGKPYLFQAQSDVLYCFYGTTIVSDPINTGAMKGTFEDMTLTDLTNIYYFAQKALWSCVDLTSLSVPANRAYVKMDEMPAITESNPAPGVRRITLGVNGQNTATGVENIGTSEQPMKMIIDGQLYIIRGEKTYDAQGKLVK